MSCSIGAGHVTDSPCNGSYRTTGCVLPCFTITQMSTFPKFYEMTDTIGGPTLQATCYHAISKMVNMIGLWLFIAVCESCCDMLLGSCLVAYEKVIHVTLACQSVMPMFIRKLTHTSEFG